MDLKLISTNISDIRSYANASTFFISGWDKSPAMMNLSDDMIIAAGSNYQNGKNNYYFMHELDDIKEVFCLNTGLSHLHMNCKNVAISPNGTSAIFLSILAIKKQYKNFNVLLLSPTYFTDINVLQSLEINFYHMQVNIFKKPLIDFDELEIELTKKSIDLLIITDPIFGTGISISNSIYKIILNLAKRLGIWVLIDYIYGGMEWDRPISIINLHLLKLITSYKKTILIESISKRLFLNGVKHANIYSNSSIIPTIEELSVSFIGSFSYLQYELFRNMYQPENKKNIIEQIEGNLCHIKNTYSLLQTLLLDTDILLSNITSGYFVLMGIPRKYLNMEFNNGAAISILKETNILTIPHNRYLYENSTHYCFRVNLTMDKNALIKGVNLLLNTYIK